MWIMLLREGNGPLPRRGATTHRIPPSKPSTEIRHGHEPLEHWGPPFRDRRRHSGPLRSKLNMQGGGTAFHREISVKRNARSDLAQHKQISPRLRSRCDSPPPPARGALWSRMGTHMYCPMRLSRSMAATSVATGGGRGRASPTKEPRNVCGTKRVRVQI